MTLNVKNISGSDSGNINNGGMTVKTNRNSYKYRVAENITQVAISTLLDEIELKVVVNSATQSDPIDLPLNQDFTLTFTSDGAFVLDVQEGVAGNFSDSYYDDGTTKVTIDSSTGPQSIVVTGGHSYRMDVDTYNNPITMTAYRTQDE